MQAASATTPALRVKALAYCLARAGGRGAVRALLSLLGWRTLPRDERSPVPRELWLRALRHFEATLGEAGFAELPRALLEPQNLGAWSPLLRGARRPEEVLERLAKLPDGEPGLGCWTEVEATAGRAVARAARAGLDAGDAGRVARALAAEVRAALELAGLLAGSLELRVTESTIEVELRYRRPAGLRLSVGLGAVGAAGALAAGAAVALAATAGQTAVSAGGAAALAATGSWLAAREGAHRRVAAVQRRHILALEREARLRGTLPSTESAELIAGEYQLGARLGSGGGGAVWAAVRVSDGAPVALKLLRRSVAGEGRALDRMTREAEVLSLTWHPSIVRVLDQGALPEGGAYIAFELLRGETLGERLRRVATLPAPEVVALGLAAADALWAVHRAGVVHRDVKPDNLFLHRDGQGEVLKLLDFGVAYVTWAETRLTRDGASVGTRGYAPPEQELGREVDARADVYALGVTLTEVLTGARPPAGAATTLSEEPPLAHSATARIDRGCEGPLRALLERMTAEDPAERPADMLAVREALEAARALGERPSGGPSRAQGSR